MKSDKVYNEHVKKNKTPSKVVSALTASKYKPQSQLKTILPKYKGTNPNELFNFSINKNLSFLDYKLAMKQLYPNDLLSSYETYSTYVMAFGSNLSNIGNIGNESCYKHCLHKCFEFSSNSYRCGYRCSQICNKSLH